MVVVVEVVVVVMAEDWVHEILTAVLVFVGVAWDIDVATSAGCTMGGECRSSGAGEEDVDEPEEIKIGSWLLLLLAVVCSAAG